MPAWPAPEPTTLGGVEYEIAPEPSDDERVAILTALAEPQEPRSGWAEAALPVPEEPDGP